jgi:hypothetical protein
MSPLRRLATRFESGDGLVSYVLVLAPLAAIVGLVIVTLIMAQPR